MALKLYQTEFIELAMDADALRFGEFTLKSGRVSPYFFNAGQFSSGEALLKIGRCYASAIVEAGIEFDLLFGPAYKGIPLAAATAIALADQHGKDVPYAFNRKEAKDHGEGGTIVGSRLEGKVLIIDDVITAGTAIREVEQIIRSHSATPVGVVIGVDRCERGRSDLSAVQEVQRDLDLEVLNIVNVHNIRDFLSREPENGVLVSRMDSYRQRYGV